MANVYIGIKTDMVLLITMERQLVYVKRYAMTGYK